MESVPYETMRSVDLSQADLSAGGADVAAPGADAPPPPGSTTGFPDCSDALAAARRVLEASFCLNEGHWRSGLSASALSTAVALFALHLADAQRHRREVSDGLRWLAGHANEDGGWGDTTDSPSNISATVLAWSAMSIADCSQAPFQCVAHRASEWIGAHAGGIDPEAVTRAIVAHYENDRTFSTPILVMAALAGRLDAPTPSPPTSPWRRIVQLPFELAVAPPRLFHWLRLGVVSYALPALIAMGLARHRRARSTNTPAALLRDLVTPRCLRIAARMQPSNGGYEEAIPLTAFVAMALVAAGEDRSPIVSRCMRFLLATQRADGSWPIDTNLDTWTTVLAVNALHAAGATDAEAGCVPHADAIRAWLLAQQHAADHPLTFGGKGGWAWTDLPGGMPDADDTAGALLALRRLGPLTEDVRSGAARGAAWLLALQNTDGGIPTFCRGWGRLPFDRSCPDITAHAVRALSEWQNDFPPTLRRRVTRALPRALRYLARSQRPDGSWTPLWFGNQHAAAMANPVYGTAQVLTALHAAAQTLPEDEGREAVRLLDRARRWLLAAQRSDGGWGGDTGAPASIEETALAIRSLAVVSPASEVDAALAAGATWLLARTQNGRTFQAAPIGLYFAKLWYAEALYPIVFSIDALAALCRRMRLQAPHRSAHGRSGTSRPTLPCHGDNGKL